MTSRKIIIISIAGLFIVTAGMLYALSISTNSATLSLFGNTNSKSIHMGMNMFMPNQLQISPNTQVTWQTHDMDIHNVYGIFKTDSGKKITILSGDMTHMQEWSYTFEESGIFEYACGYHEHEGMTGKLVVA